MTGSRRTRGCGKPLILSGRLPAGDGVVFDSGGAGAGTNGLPVRGRAVAWFTRRNYLQHRALDPGGLPATFDEWLARAEGGLVRATPTLRVVIDPVQFSAWCRAASREADAAARAAFAQIVARAANRRV